MTIAAMEPVQSEPGKKTKLYKYFLALMSENNNNNNNKIILTIQSS